MEEQEIERTKDVGKSFSECWKKASKDTTLQSLALAASAGLAGLLLDEYTSLEGAAHANYLLSGFYVYGALYSYSLKNMF